LTNYLIVPYQSSYDPFIRNCIEDYSFKPDKIEFVGPGKWKNAGEKINDKFLENKDVEFLIFHRAASLLNPDDLKVMMDIIKKNQKILQIGIEPAFCYPGIRAPKMSDNKNYDSAGGVTIWRAKLYFELIDEAIKLCKKEHISITEIFSYVGFLGNKKGYKTLQATKARIVYYD